jgi:DNA-binding LacI/PurR family transcriptional regulator
MPPAPKKRATLSEIATALDISKCTVSLALRDSPKVKPGTVERVKAKAAELGYKPHPRFRTLATMRWEKGVSREETIAIVLSSREEVNPRSGWIHAEPRAAEMGYRTEFFALKDYPSLKRLRDVIYHRGITGVYFPQYCQIPAEPGIDWNDFAAVAVGDRNEHLGVDLVRPNPFDSVSLAWRKMREHGWRRIGGFFPHDPEGASNFDVKRVAAFEYWQKRELEPEERIPVLESDVMDVAAFREWYAEHRPEALISLLNAVYLQPEYLEGFDPKPAFVAVKGARDSVSGCPNNHEQIQADAIDWLDQKIRRGFFGSSSSRAVHVIAPLWHAGESLFSKQYPSSAKRPSDPKACTSIAGNS